MREGFKTQEQAVALVSNLLNLAQPAVANELVKARSLTIVNSAVTKSVYMQAVGVEDKAKDFKLPDGFPLFPATPTDVGISNGDPKNAYAGASMVLFSLGKEFTSENETGAIVNRPRALKGQLGMSDESFVSAPGTPDGPSITSLGQVYTAFNVFTEVRAIIIKVFLSIYRQPDHKSPEMSLMMISMQMLDGAQMTHVGAVQDVLEAHPWLVKVPSLRPSIKEYINELRRFSQVPQGIRGYIRLIETNQNLYFPSSKMKPLVAVAVSLKSDIEESLKNYAGGKGQYTELVTEVRQYQASFSMQKGVDTLASVLEVPDVPLPKISEATVLTPGTGASTVQ